MSTLTPRHPASATSARARIGRAAVHSRREAIPTWLLAAGLVCAFGVWFSWAPLVVQLQQLDTILSRSSLFSLLTTTGLSALCLRLSLGFLIRPGVEPLVLTGSLAVLTLTALGFYQVLGHPAPELWQLHGLALLSGVGGGCFSTLVYHPQRELSGASKLNAELGSVVGHLGIVVSLLLLPALVLLPLSSLTSVPLLVHSSYFLGRVDVGQPLWLSWVGLFWGVTAGLLLLLSLPYAWRLGGRVGFELGQFFAVLLLGLLLAGLGIWWLIPEAPGGIGPGVSPELVVTGVLFIAMAVIGFCSRANQVENNFQIFNNKHTWVMTILWIAGLGSFLGFSMTFPLLMSGVFSVPEIDSGRDSPGVFLYAWMLPLVAILTRPLGTWCSARWGGSRVTQVCLGALVLAALLVAYWLYRIQGASYSPPFFSGFMLAFALLFTASGLMHASLLSTLPRLFPAVQWRTLGIWYSSVSVLGVVYIPLVLNEHLDAGMPARAMLGCALFYGVCFLLNGWWYLRRHAPIYNP